MFALHKEQSGPHAISAFMPSSSNSLYKTVTHEKVNRKSYITYHTPYLSWQV